jgi:crotonobetainyl-CoA:carnitine CoA-transferase CaiB-like acyl-CoA transferase
VRALDLTRVLAGPTCGRTLAAHGADVLRIGSPHLPSVPPFVMDTSHGKRSAHLDLRSPADAERLRALVRGADVFAQGYRSGALARLGFGPEALFELRPGLVYTSINCYGHEGPWVERPGWEQLAQTVTGIALEQGGAAGPQLLPAAATDYNTGYLAALGTLVALARRAREGGSYWVRASLSRTGMWLERMGRTDSVGPGLGAEQIRPHLTRSSTPFGELSHLGPIVELSETPARWALPTVPLGTHPAEWAKGG